MTILFTIVAVALAAVGASIIRSAMREELCEGPAVPLLLCIIGIGFGASVWLAVMA